MIGVIMQGKEHGHERPFNPSVQKSNGSLHLAVSGRNTQAIQLVSSSLAVTPSAAAKRSMLSTLMLRSSRSTAPTYVRWSPALAAKASCDQPLSCLSSRKFVARTARLVGRASIPKYLSYDDDESTDDE